MDKQTIKKSEEYKYYKSQLIFNFGLGGIILFIAIFFSFDSISEGNIIDNLPVIAIVVADLLLFFSWGIYYLVRKIIITNKYNDYEYYQVYFNHTMEVKRPRFFYVTIPDVAMNVKTRKLFDKDRLPYDSFKNHYVKVGYNKKTHDLIVIGLVKK